MGGITGFFEPGISGDDAQWRGVLEIMSATIRHRGPNVGGIWVDLGVGLGLAYRRLAARESESGLPHSMWSSKGHYRIAFSGTIHNARQLAKELSDHGEALRDRSSVEVILACLQRWGLEDTLQRLHGGFAFALWDVRQRRLQLVRDRLGEKPLYYGICGRTLLFGSELKALRVHPAWSGEICRQSLMQLLRYGYIPEPRSIYRDIYKLPPGTWLSLDAEKLSDGRALAVGGEHGPRVYWAMRSAAEAGLANPWGGTTEGAVDELERHLQAVIGEQMANGLPTGAFLSGGIDSSTVVALMQAQSPRPVQTFTIGFEESCYDEAQHAKAVAQHLGTEHAELYVNSKDAHDLIPRLPQIYDEPFADPSQIPMILASQFARGRVAATLAGDGGDELFAGYNRYLWTEKVWSRRNQMSPMFRAVLANTLAAVPAPYLNRLFALIQSLLPMTFLRQPNIGGKLHKLAAALRADSPTELYRTLMSYWQQPELLIPGVVEPGCDIRSDNALAGAQTLIESLLYWDLTGYLPGSNLVKLDRAAMSVGLHVHLPLLDHRLVEFAWRIPISLKLNNGQSKWLLRQVAYRHIPQALLERPKMGFSPPVSAWLRGPLQEWGKDLLAPDRLERQGLLAPEAIQHCWKAHQAGREDAALPLWSMLMFQAWHDEQRQRGSVQLVKQARVDVQGHAFADSAEVLPSNF
jgi:asparagine synthase (glutamine-hydrolysing)